MVDPSPVQWHVAVRGVRDTMYRGIVPLLSRVGGFGLGDLRTHAGNDQLLALLAPCARGGEQRAGHVAVLDLETLRLADGLVGLSCRQTSIKEALGCLRAAPVCSKDTRKVPTQK